MPVRIARFLRASLESAGFDVEDLHRHMFALCNAARDLELGWNITEQMVRKSSGQGSLGFCPLTGCLPKVCKIP